MYEVALLAVGFIVGWSASRAWLIIKFLWVYGVKR